MNVDDTKIVQIHGGLCYHTEYSLNKQWHTVYISLLLGLHRRIWMEKKDNIPFQGKD